MEIEKIVTTKYVHKIKIDKTELKFTLPYEVDIDSLFDYICSNIEEIKEVDNFFMFWAMSKANFVGDIGRYMSYWFSIDAKNLREDLLKFKGLMNKEEEEKEELRIQLKEFFQKHYKE